MPAAAAAAAAALLLAVGPARVLFEGELTVPRSRARGIPVPIQRPTYLHGKYEVRTTGARVRVTLLTADAVRAFQEGQAYEMLAATPYGGTGELRFLVMRPGDYFMLVDNRLDERTSLTVHAVVTGAEDPSLPGTLPVSRRRWIAAISLALFAAVAGWSGRRLQRAWSSSLE